MAAQMWEVLAKCRGTADFWEHHDQNGEGTNSSIIHFSQNQDKEGIEIFLYIIFTF